MATGDLWDRVLARIETKINRHSFYTWFKPTAFIGVRDGELHVRVPNLVFRDWLNKHYGAVLEEALAEAGESDRTVQFLTETEPEPEVPAVTPDEIEQASDEYVPAPITGSSGLNARYTFDTFIVGSSNQFAHAAARAVAELPSRSYNPLFIYGGVGLGKTHLMHAIGRYVLEHFPGSKLTYISAERFMNEMIQAIRFDRLVDFRERYRSVDVLLVDDIQFIAGKDGTQSEFFHTFNALHDAQKQIVLSSDSPPAEIQAIEERLRSRFEWGLVADIQPPDLETKVAILKKKAEAEAAPLPDSVALYIAGKIKSNVRELEGSLIRLVAFASLTGQQITLQLAQEVLKNVLGHDEKVVTMDSIQKYVADHYKLKVADLRSRNNAKSVAIPRQVAMYVCKTLTHASLPEIGRAFGGKHHSTVIHSIRKVERQRQADPAFNSVVNSFIEAFR
jgi:chromosomal replication initiator protein